MITVNARSCSAMFEFRTQHKEKRFKSKTTQRAQFILKLYSV